ncbi:MAG TPA: alpha/beta hydrolase-fold protein [Candidatus Limnocylindria bacterium]|nr:alpha/beta hydrolase-fold protein [Candidatus Limnocylindria bacterium]
MRLSRRRVAAIAIALALLAAVGAFAYRFVLHGSTQLIASDPWTTSASIHSDLLGRDMPIEIFQPPQAQDCISPPVLFLFHGSGADQGQWMAGNLGLGVGVDKIAHQLIDQGRIRPVTIVSALIDKSYGVDSPPSEDVWSHGPYESYITTELIPQVDARYAVGLIAADRAIGGLSMGGFAAMNAAFRNPGMFGNVAGLSPAFFVSPPADRDWIYSGTDGRHDLLTLADEGGADGLHLFLGHGDSDYDWVGEATDELAARLHDHGIVVEPVVVSGGHDVATWRQLAVQMLLDLFPSGTSAC